MKLCTLFITIILLAGCSSLPSVEQLFASLSDEQVNQADSINEGQLTQSNGVVDINASALGKSMPDLQSQTFGSVDAFGSINKPSIMSSTHGSYKSMPLTKHVGDYVRNMAQDLVSNMEYVSERTPVAVTHFSLIDSDLKQTNLLGQQMAESFVHEFHKFRMPVVEFKATQFIRVTDLGDFVMSRDFLDLKNSTPIQYVLTGTMTKHQGGFIVNARMLGMQSNVVVASAQSFIPFYIVDALLPSGSSRQNDLVDGVRIIRGE
ncbi:MAG: TolB-like protein [Alphaproteobacteria bacterium]|jgi:TolB-like protein